MEETSGKIDIYTFITTQIFRCRRVHSISFLKSSSFSWDSTLTFWALVSAKGRPPRWTTGLAQASSTLLGTPLPSDTHPLPAAVTAGPAGDLERASLHRRGFNLGRRALTTASAAQTHFHRLKTQVSIQVPGGFPMEFLLVARLLVHLNMDLSTNIPFTELLTLLTIFHLYFL